MKKGWGICCAGLLACLLAGCASDDFKGTPFYTPEAQRKPGAEDDRVSLWPLVYYRDPVLSVFWPFIEKSDDYFAVRPVYSVYGRASSNRIHNVLWPLARYEEGDGTGHVFPVFWGDDYACVFPLYWHFREGAGGVYDGVIPLYSYFRQPGQYSLYAPWPIIHSMRQADQRGWHVWPVAGSYTSDSSYYRFAAWPFFHAWSDETARSAGNTLLPLYYQQSGARGRLFLSLPYSAAEWADGSGWALRGLVNYASHSSAGNSSFTPVWSYGYNRAEDRHWSWVLPLYYASHTTNSAWFASLLGGYSRGPDSGGWLLVPGLAGGRWDGTEAEHWMLGPLAHSRRTKYSTTQHVFPLYFRHEDPAVRSFLSLPWSSVSRTNGSGWSAAVPFYYHSVEPGRTTWGTLLGGYSRTDDGRSWAVYPLMTGGRRSPDGGSLWLLGPMAHVKWDARNLTHHVLPLYYWNRADERLISPLLARWKDDAGARKTLCLPTLSLWTTRTNGGDVRFLAGLCKAAWGHDAGAHYALPFYYRNPQTDSFISLPYVRRRAADGTAWRGSPLLLTWNQETAGRTTVRTLGGLVGYSKDGYPASHVFPFYSWNGKSRDFHSLFYWSSWDEEGRRHHAYPLLLSEYINGPRKEIWGALGLYHAGWGNAQPRFSYLFPAYARTEGDFFYTPLAGWKQGSNGFVYPLTPLVGFRTGGAYRGGWVWPLFSLKSNRVDGSRDDRFLVWGSHTRKEGGTETDWFPFFGYENTRSTNATAWVGRKFWCLPACWYENRTNALNAGVRKHGFFPLWSYSSERQAGAPTRVSGRMLLWLYQYERNVPAAADQPQTRRRVLWYLWNSETMADGSRRLDVFPAITWDRRPDGYRKASFLYRLFRYETGPAGRKLDLLFIPLMRP